jgi:NiFe hydrogenase small subunit HydA
MRPLIYYGKTVHDCCPRIDHFNHGRFAKSHGDTGAKQGYCLYELGCKGPETFSACTTVKWNQATSSPTHSGHGCLGCTQPHFWDREHQADGTFGSFYSPDTKFLQDFPGAATDCAAPAPLITG